MNTVDKEIGLIPTKKAPKKGDSITLTIDGLPPKKNLSMSIRNKKSKDYPAFKRLRLAALKSMGGRKWYDGPLEISVSYYTNKDDFRYIGTGYIGGIMDTLGGSHGFTFTFLPIVYQDDCQPSSISQCARKSINVFYTVQINFQ